jgi:hypothetical protein
MSGIVGSRLNTRGSGLVGSLGSDGQVFTSSGAGESAVFEAAAGGGKILQVVTAVDTTQRSTNSLSFVTASSSATVAITPAATSSKIYALLTGNFSANDGDDGWCVTLYRDSTNLGNATVGLASGNSISTIQGLYIPTTMSVLDSPSSTSELTYQLYVKLTDADDDSAGNFYTGQVHDQGSNYTPVHLTCFEIGA